MSYQRVKTVTPWGKADSKIKVTRGINFYSTPGHGGYKVSKKLNASMPAPLRNSDGWYEEDCEWCKVVLAFPQHFNEDKKETARAVFALWFNNDGTYKQR